MFGDAIRWHANHSENVSQSRYNRREPLALDHGPKYTSIAKYVFSLSSTQANDSMHDDQLCSDNSVSF